MDVAKPEFRLYYAKNFGGRACKPDCLNESLYFTTCAESRSHVLDAQGVRSVLRGSWMVSETISPPSLFVYYADLLRLPGRLDRRLKDRLRPLRHETKVVGAHDLAMSHVQ